MIIKKKLFNYYYFLSENKISYSKLLLVKDPLKKARNKNKWINNDKGFLINEEKKLFPKWDPANTSMLWKYHLHSFEYLNNIKSNDEGIKIINDWKNNHIPEPKVSWHPYNLSLRICNWIWFISTLENFNKKKLNTIISSIYQQTQFLENHLEREKEGNHLIENCKALIIAGTFFNNKKWKKKGFLILENELRKQVNNEGSHYEKSAMYHAIVLECFLTIYLTTKNDNAYKIVNEKLLGVIKKMSRYLADIQIKNQLPIQHDSCKNLSCDLEQLFILINKIAKINNPPITEVFYTEIGNYIYKNNKIYLLFDIGNPEPFFRPGHAHNSVFHYDLYLDNEPILCDSGVFEYESTSMRNLLRSTESHNTIQVNETELNPIWGSFRMVRNGSVKNIVIEDKTVVAEHNYYQNSEKCLVQRKLKILENDEGIKVEDNITSKKKEIVIKDYLHFSPNIKVLKKEENEKSILYKLNSLNNEITLKIYKINNERVFESFSYYSEEFNKKEKRLKLIIETISKKELTTIKYTLKKIKK